MDEKLGVMKDIHKVPKIAGANLEFGQKTRWDAKTKGDECKKINNPRQTKIIEFDVFLNFF